MQTEYSLWTRDVEAQVLPTLRELGIGLVAYSPLGRLDGIAPVGVAAGTRYPEPAMAVLET